MICGRDLKSREKDVKKADICRNEAETGKGEWTKYNSNKKQR